MQVAITNHHTKQAQLERAFQELEYRLDQGFEWPDAHTAVCVHFNVNGDELSAYYDEHASIACRYTHRG